MGVRRFKSITIGFSVIAAMLAIEGATPVLATSIKLSLEEAQAHVNLLKKYGERWWDFTEVYRNLELACEVATIKGQACNGEPTTPWPVIQDPRE
jgi:hypothetical protein